MKLDLVFEPFLKISGKDECLTHITIQFLKQKYKKFKF